MPTWRDSLSPQAQTQVDELLSESLELGRNELLSRGAFFPFANVITLEGRALTLQITPEQASQEPDVQDVLNACRTFIDHQREGLAGTAVTTDVHTPDGGDAMCIEVQHREGVAINAFLPYEQVVDPTYKVTFGELRLEAADATVFV